MKSLRKVLLLALLLPFAAHAQSEQEAQAFNAAWIAYQEAAAGEDVAARIDAARNVLAIGEQIFDAGDERVAMLAQNLGSALLAGGHDADARAQLERALAMQEARYGKDAVQLAPIYVELADASGGPGQAQRHLGLYKQALKIAEDKYGRKSEVYANLALRAAMNVLDKSRSTSGDKYLGRARDYFTETHGATDSRVGVANYYFGQMGFLERQYDRAAGALREALKSFAGDDAVSQRYRYRVRKLLVQSYERLGQTDLATEQCLSIGREFPYGPEQRPEPLYRVAPVYPRKLLGNFEGYADIRFDIDAQGFVRNPIVIDEVRIDPTDGSQQAAPAGLSNPDESFAVAALEAARQFRYAPRFENGEAVVLRGVDHRVTFVLE